MFQKKARNILGLFYCHPEPVEGWFFKITLHLLLPCFDKLSMTVLFLFHQRQLSLFSSICPSDYSENGFGGLVIH